MAFMNNFNTIYQNLNHYQNLIDQIEKSGTPAAKT